MTGKHAVNAGDIFNREALRNMRNALMGRRFKFAVFRGKVPQNRSKECGFAAAVGADQTDAFARLGNEIGVSVEQSRPAHQREVEKSKHERGGAFRNEGRSGRGHPR